MADTDVWGLGAIASPAGTDRVPVATAAGAGGYSPRSDFAWRLSTGEFDVFGGNSAKTVIGIGSLSGDANPGYQLKGTLSALPTSQTRGFIATGDSAIGTAGDLLIAPRTDAACSIRFLTGASGAAETARINASGNLGIGTIAPAARLHAKSTAEIARFETTTARGGGNGFIGIADPTGRKCYFGYGGANDVLYVANQLNGAVTIATNDIPRWNFGSAGAFEPAADNTYNIGHISFRVKDTHLVNSPTVTSDATEKEWLGAGFSPAELAAAKRITAEVGSYKWLTAIAREADGGPAARIHFGVRAQAVWAIMADEGLIDPIEEGVAPSCPYAFLCWDPMEEGDTVGRFGIRPDQLAMFLIAAQEARIAALEAIITEGE